MNSPCVLLVEDDRELARVIISELQSMNYQVEHCVDGQAAIERIRPRYFSAIILDLMLPKIEGSELCRIIRQSDKHTPIVILTARNAEADKVLLLELGADDFISKPFGLAELRARVRAAVRRGKLSNATENKSAELQIGDLVISEVKRKVYRNDVDIPLTALEFDYVYILAQSPGRVFSREQLAAIVHGYEAGNYDHSVSSAINRIRAKLEPDPSEPRYILTVRGSGYCFSDSL